MPNPHNYPTEKNAAILWKINVHEKIEGHGQTCAFPGQELVETKDDLANLIYLDRDCIGAVERFLKALNLCRLEAARGDGTNPVIIPPLPILPPPPPPRPPGMLSRAFNVLSRLKLSPKFTEAMGLDLGIIMVVSIKADSVYPEITLALGQGVDNVIVIINFKKGRHDGIYLEWRIRGGEWEFCAIDNAKPHIHDCPLQVANVPEIREYRARYWDKGQANGLWSPVQTITVAP